MAACRLSGEFELGIHIDSAKSLRIAASRVAAIGAEDVTLSEGIKQRFLSNVAIHLLHRALSRAQEERHFVRNSKRQKHHAQDPSASWICDAALTLLMSEREHRAEAAAILREGCPYEGLVAHIIDYLETA
jgi:hypothetical protein